MIKVTIVGTGNISYHLQKAFSVTEEVHLVQVLQSRVKTFDSSLNHSSDIKNPKETDIYIIAVSDDAITSVAQHLSTTEKLVVHTSGSKSLNSLSPAIRKGVFYPLQTFSKEREVDFKTIPICIESNDSKDMELLKRLALAISDKVFEIDSKKRKALHLAAVFVNNFSNHMYQLADTFCEENNVSFDLLKPLIKETAAKIETLTPLEAQTGPATRNDTHTIKRHLEQLKTKKQKEIYSILTESIRDTYGEKL